MASRRVTAAVVFNNGNIMAMHRGNNNKLCAEGGEECEKQKVNLEGICRASLAPIGRNVVINY